ncbi:MAG: hypothetical protein RIS19_566 [Actinomycetota bacterium]
MSFRLRKPLLSTLLILALGLSSTQSATAAQPVSGISTTVYNEGTDAAAVFYNPVVVSNVDLTMPQATIDALNADPNASTYRTADVKITTADGVITTLTNIGVRLKGQATRRLINNYDKAPMKLKFDAFVAGQKFMGLTRMTLNSMVQDPSFIREDTSYRIYRAMGLVAPRTTYSWVTVNNADFGLYMNVEAIDGQMLKRWLNPVHVYSSNCYLADLTLSQSWCYDTNYGDTNRADLNAAIAVSVYDGATWWTEVNKIADMTSVINLMATDIYTSNWDGYTDVVQNNYYIVFDDTGKLKIIPWGQDGTFPMENDAQLDWLGRGPAYRNFGNQERSVMLRKCVAYDPCKKLLIKAQVAVKDKVATLGIPAFKNKVASVINNAYIAHDVRSNSSVASAVGWQNWLDQFFPMRTASLTAFLKTLNPEAPEISVSGSNAVGSTLTATAVNWDYTTTLNYQWLRNSVAIPNQTGTTYVTTSADAGALISVKVLATKTSKPSATSSSVPILVIRPALAAASLTGEARVGVPIVGGPLAEPSATVTYKWLADGKTISGANQSTYTPSASDYKKSLSLQTTVTQEGYPVNVTTSPAKVVAGGLLAKPSLSVKGTAKTGSRLTISTSVPALTTASYQWLRNGKAISGATKSAYTLQSADYKSSITAKVTLTRAGYITTSTTSSSLKVGIGELIKTPDPRIVGTAKVSNTLSAQVGSWDSGVTFTYQWIRDGAKIAKATGKSYRLTTADRKAEIAVSVKAVKLGFATVTIDSPAVIVR